MKAVAFVCLLSLSLCLSLPTSLPDAPPSQAAVKTDKTNLTKQEATEQSTQAPIIKIVTQAGANNTEHSTSPSPNETKPSDGKPQTEKANKTETSAEKAAENGSKPTEPTKKVNETSTEGAPPKPTEEGKAGVVTTTTTATEKPSTESAKSTEAPKDTTEKPLVGKRGFDGPSFIGGIILTLGLLAIGFMGFKYYKNQTERNYHTL